MSENKKIRVLFIDGCGIYGGACRSLSENIYFLQNEIESFILCPKGSANKLFKKISKNLVNTKGLTKFDNTLYSYYKGLRWLVLLRELFFFPYTILYIVYIKLKWKKIDIIHANEITDFIPLILCKLLFKAKTIVHCRSIYRNSKNSIRTKLINYILVNNVDVFIAIDNNVKESLPKDFQPIVINNSFSLDVQALIKDVTEDNTLPNSLNNKLKIGYVGNLSKGKGINHLLRSTILLGHKRKKIHIYVAGAQTRKYNRFLSKILNYFGIISEDSEKLLRFINFNDLQSNITFFGHLNNIQKFYESIDILCFPTKYNAPGRPIIEAAFFSKPSIASIDKPFKDTFIDKVTGYATKVDDDVELSKIISKLIDNRSIIIELGNNANKLFKRNHDPKVNSQKLLNVYNSLIKLNHEL